MEARQQIRVLSYNIGQTGLRTAIAKANGLAGFLNSLNADIVCLQETKVRRQELEREAALAQGWDSYFSHPVEARTGYAGVATFCRTAVTVPLAAEEGFTGVLGVAPGIKTASEGPGEGSPWHGYAWAQLDALDAEGRCVITDHGAFVLLNVYGPAVCGDGERGEERWRFKMAFWEAMLVRLRCLVAAGRNAMLVGDANISLEPIDRPDPADDYLDRADRRLLRRIMAHTCAAEGCPGQGWLADAFRLHHPGRAGNYSCWSAATSARVHNWGSRIDHVWLAGGCPLAAGLQGDRQGDAAGQDGGQGQTPQAAATLGFAGWVTACDLWPELQGSDHCPIWADVRLPAGQALPLGHAPPPLASSCRFKGKQVTIRQLFGSQPAAAAAPAAAQQGSDSSSAEGQEHPAAAASLPPSQGHGSQPGAGPASQQAPDSLRPKLGAGASGSSGAKRRGSALAQPGGGQRLLHAFFSPSSKQRHTGVRSATQAGGAARQEPLPSQLPAPTAPQGAATAGSGPGLGPAAPPTSGGGGGGPALLSQAEARDAFRGIWSKVEPPQCKCREPAVLRTSNTAENKGRLFYVCARPVGPPGVGRCDFFKWESDAKKRRQGGAASSASGGGSGVASGKRAKA